MIPSRKKKGGKKEKKRKNPPIKWFQGFNVWIILHVILQKFLLTSCRLIEEAWKDHSQFENVIHLHGTSKAITVSMDRNWGDVQQATIKEKTTNSGFQSLHQLSQWYKVVLPHSRRIPEYFSIQRVCWFLEVLQHFNRTCCVSLLIQLHTLESFSFH